MATSSQIDVLESVRRLGQQCLESAPVIILGSGASAPMGIRGMRELSDYLQFNVVPNTDEERRSWDEFKADLPVSQDIESTLQKINLPPALLQAVVSHTRTMIREDDEKAFVHIIKRARELPMSRLLKHLFGSTHTRLALVTTNYDRLAEYAADSAKFAFNTSFSSGYYQTFNSPQPNRRAIPATRRILDIWKVHGSIDWFVDPDGNPIALPSQQSAPDGYQPLLVTPGAAKFEITHKEPFRTIMTSADAALSEARGFLCVGYGFNDQHIEPKLVQRVRDVSVPIVILARTLRNSAKAFLKGCRHDKYLALERSSGGSRAYSFAHPDGIEMNAALWDFSDFLDHTIGPG